MVAVSRRNIDLFNPVDPANYPLPTAFSFANFSIAKAGLNSMVTEKHYYMSFNLELTLTTQVNFEKDEEVDYSFINSEHSFIANNSINTKLVYADKLIVPIRLDFDFFENDRIETSGDEQGCRTVFKAYDYDDPYVYNESLSANILTRRSIEAILVYRTATSGIKHDIIAMFKLGAMGQSLNLEYNIKDLEHNFPANCLTIITDPTFDPYVVKAQE